MVEIYDPRQDTWQLGVAMPTALSGYALAVFEGNLYLFGGWVGKTVSDLVLAFDPDQNRWEELPPMPTRRAFAGAAVTGRKIYVFGGYDGQGALATNEVFQPDLIDNPDAWDEATAMPEGIYAMGATSLADIIYVVGGESAAERQFPVLAFFPQNNDWQAFEVSATPVGSQLSLVSLGTNLIALGGQIDGTRLANNMAYRAIFTVSIPVIIK